MRGAAAVAVFDDHQRVVALSGPSGSITQSSRIRSLTPLSGRMRRGYSAVAADDPEIGEHTGYGLIQRRAGVATGFEAEGTIVSVNVVENAV